MAIEGLRNVISADLIRSLSGTSSSTSNVSSASPSTPIDSATIQSALRSGADQYTIAFQQLNGVISEVNLSRDTLEELLGLTEDMIGVAERAAKDGVSEQTRGRLDVRFKRLVDEFEEVLSKEQNGSDLLSKEGLTSFFQNIGLDEDSSKNFAAILNNFVSPENKSDFSFASDKVRNDKAPTAVPSNADIDYVSSTAVAVNAAQEGNVAKTEAVLTDVGLVREGTDDIVGNNPGFTSVISQTDGPTVTGLVPGLSSNVELLAVNEVTGYSIIASTEDFLGQNAGGNLQVFGVDAIGNVVQQYTNFNADIDDIVAGDISSDNLSVAISYHDNNAGNNIIGKFTVASLGSDPTAATVLTQATADGGGGIATSTNVEISNSGTYVAFADHGGTGVNLLNGAFAADAYVAGRTGTTGDFGFLGDGTIGLVSGSGAQVEVIDYGAGSTEATITSLDVETGVFDTLESDAVFGFRDDTTDNVLLYTYTAATTSATSETAYTALTGTVNTFSLAQNTTLNTVDFGVDGTVLGASNRELNRFQSNIEYNNYQPLKIGDIDAAGPSINNGISAVNSVISDTDDTTLAYNASNISLLTTSVGGITGSITQTLTENVELMDVNTDTGYSIIQTTQDLLGFNTDNRSQLFMVDVGGRVVSQITDNETVNSYRDASFTSDNKTVVYTIIGSTDGEGDGTFLAFTSPTHTTPDFTATNTLVGDVDSDGIVDLIRGNTISIGNGDGTFAAAATVGSLSAQTTTGGGVNVIGDFNNDGNLDLVKENTTVGSYEIVFGNGDGTFSARTVQTNGATSGASIVETRDIDGDGELDLVFADDGGQRRIRVALGNADGTFNAATSYTTYGAGNDISASFGNFDGDANLDMIQRFATGAAIRLGNGDGTFQAAVTVETGTAIDGTPAIGDFDGDSNTDYLVVSDNGTNTTFRINSGDGAGGFTGITTQTFAGVGHVNDYQTFDFDNDGNLDIVGVSEFEHLTRVFLGNGDGTFNGPVSYSTQDAEEVLIADINNDGIEDLTVGRYDTSDDSTSTTVLEGQGAEAVRERVGKSVILNFGVNPASNTHSTIVEAAVTPTESDDTFSNIRISNDGTHIGYIYNDGTNTSVRLLDAATETVDAFLQADTGATQFEFIDSNQIVRLSPGFAGGDIQRYTYGSSTFNIDAGAASLSGVGQLAAIEKGQANDGEYRYTFEDTANSQVTLIDETGAALVSYTIDALDSIASLSIIDEPSGDHDVTIGLFGDLSEVSGDTDNELYRLTVDDETTLTATNVGDVARQFSRIFDKDRTLTSRSDAIALVSDLKDLKAQIETNLEALDDITNYLAENLEFIRTTGNAFLNASNQISSALTAEQVAAQIRSQIRNNAETAITAQAGNLEGITAAAQTLNSIVENN